MQTLKERAQHVMRKGSIEDYENFVQEIANAPTPEPFGYFKAEPFGWTDCAETDDGAIALYELPPAPSVPVEPMENIALNEWLDKTEWVQKQLNTFPVSSLGMHRADVMRLEIDRLRKLLSAAPTPAEAQADVARDAERYRKIAIAVMCCRSIKFNEGGPVYDAAGCVMDSFDPEAVIVAGSGQRYVADSIEAALLEMYRAEFEPDDAAMSEKGQS